MSVSGYADGAVVDYQALRGVWLRALNLDGEEAEAASGELDLFDLGGSSVHALSIAAGVSQLLDRDIQIKDVMANPTPQAFLSFLKAERILSSTVPRASTPPGPRQVAEAVLDIARREPSRLAVLEGGTAYTYGELVEAASGLSDSFSDRLGNECGPVRVAIHGTRGARFMVALVACAASGLSAVPIDHQEPLDRQEALVRAAGAGFAIRANMATALGWLLEDVNQPPVNIESRGRSAPPSRSELYTLWTSGSSGEPKGVHVSAESVVNLLSEPRLNIQPTDRVGQLAPVAFDASVFEIWATLRAGATAVQLQQQQFTVDGLTTDLEAVGGVDWLFLTTGLFHLITDSAPRTLGLIGTLITGGDIVSPRHLVTASQLVRKLYVAYGPTECTVFTTLGVINPTDTLSEAPLGEPLEGVSLAIVGSDGAEVPPGAIGELLVGGRGVAIGYHSPELTDASFIVKDGKRWYKTRDLVQLDGNRLAFRGRVDRQVKIDGHRVELDSVESALDRHPDVTGSAVCVVENHGAKMVVGFVVLRQDDGGQVSLVRDWLRSQLPVHARPNRLVSVPHLPLHPNGKVNRAALPTPWTRRRSMLGLPSVDTPTTTLEEEICAIWCDELSLDVVGLSDDFFDLGGTSLIAARIIARLQPRWVVSATDFYQSGNPRSLIQHIAPGGEG